MTFQDLLRRTAWRMGKKTFLYCGEREIFYPEAIEEMDRAASALRALGVRTGDRVGVFAWNSIEFVLAMLGICRAGAIAALVDPRLAATLSYYVKDAGISVLLFGERLREAVFQTRGEMPSVREYVCLDGACEGAREWQKLLRSASPSTPAPVEETAGCHLSWTSGSTGLPKGALLAHEPTSRATSVIAERLGLTSNDVTLGPTGLSSSFHLVANLLPGLHRGCTIGLMSRWDPVEAVDTILRRGVTVFVGNPLLLADLLGEIRKRGGKKGVLRMTVSGGAPVPPDLKRSYQKELGIPLVESYGMSELGGFVALGDPSPVDDEHLPAIGRTLPDKEVMIADDEDREVPIGEPGQVCLRGGFMAGYWGRPDATEKTLKGGWLHTGDVGRIDKEGYLYMLSRLSERIRSGDHYIYPRILEEALLRHPAVHRVGVIDIPHPKLGQMAKAFVSLHRGKNATVEELFDHCRKELDPRDLPGEIEILDEMPLTPTGKIGKVELNEREAAKSKSRA